MQNRERPRRPEKPAGPGGRAESAQTANSKQNETSPRDSYRYSTRFIIKAYDGYKLTLETFSGNGTLVLSKVVPSSVKAVQIENDPDDKYYTIDGKQVGAAVSHYNTATIATSIETGSIAIVKVGDKSVKVLMK